MKIIMAVHTSRKKVGIAMYVFLLLIWIVIILIATCTNDVSALIERGEIQFSIDTTPDFSGFFQLSLQQSTSVFELGGHACIFFVLTMLFLYVTKEIVAAIMCSIVFAIITEMIQPFFGRGAELLDLLAYFFGIGLYMVLYGVVSLCLLMVQGFYRLLTVK
ncbi:VanZ family protein [Aquibacillus koreensis]|uniref:VanZ family protein n=1 Tax=Aquibacillus koreensis TaxID=279446 RepID=A0A9X3WP90_9BACI|nr:VanZ family protein [Aquibacillus koreensis]MCT2534188.1 VanZ family protein [Aquibacillus koreensis]MDC3422580.1 VanZ family protein [Aquibacillus koreensis]